MKYIKIVMRDKREMTLPFEKAEKLLDSTGQLIKLTDEKGVWTGETINKSEIVSTRRDIDAERDEMRIDDSRRILEEPKPDIEKITESLEKYNPKFLAR